MLQRARQPSAGGLPAQALRPKRFRHLASAGLACPTLSHARWRKIWLNSNGANALAVEANAGPLQVNGEDEDAQTSVCRHAGRTVGMVRKRGRAGLADQADHHGGPLRGRRSGRHHRADHGGADVRTARPAGHRRESGRRRRHDGLRTRGEGHAGRLHPAVVGQRGARHQPDALQATALQRRHRLRAGRAVFGLGARADRAADVPGQYARRVHRLCEGQPEQDAVWLGRRRNPAPTSAPSSWMSRWAPRSRMCPIAAPPRRCRT